MAFFNGEGIDLPTITKLAEAGLSLNEMATITGHSRTGIKRALERNKIPFIKHARERFIIVDGVEISLGVTKPTVFILTRRISTLPHTWQVPHRAVSRL